MRRMQIAVLLCAPLLFTSCNAVREFGQAVMSLSRCSFKLNGVSDFRIAGVSLAGKSGLGIADGAAVLTAYTGGTLPASFTLDVAVHNPNDGTSGTTKSPVTLTSLAWNLRLDDTPTISGDISSPIAIPGTGEDTVIPLRMQLDLVPFFKDKGFERILNLALALGGGNGSASRVTLRVRPTMRTDFGPVVYPGEIDLIDKEFRGQ